MTRKKEYLVLALIIFATLALRIYLSKIFFGQSSDEFCNIYLTRMTFESGFRAYPHLFMWLYYFISALLLFIIKDSFIAAKIVTLSFGIALIGIVYLVAKKIFGKKIAFLSLGLLIINPEFNLIASVPLREPVYTFFIFLSLILSMNNRIFLGALSVGLSFLTRMEGLIIGMPYYIAALLVQKIKRKLLKISIVFLMFILFVLFMNLWISRPFIYLTDTFRNQGIEDPEVVKFAYSGLYQLVLRIFNSIFTFMKYLFNLIGPNIIFLIIGTFFLFKDKNKAYSGSKVFKICYILHLLFWIAYIFIFKKIIFDFHRYLYPLIPFAMIILSYAFFKLYENIRLKHTLIFLLVFNLISGYFVYYRNVGKRYIEVSRANKELLKASLWIERNIPQDTKYKILADGVPYFYLYRHSNRFNTATWAVLYNEKHGHFNIYDLIAYIKQNNIEYVIWQNDNLAAQPLTEYFEGFREITIESARFVPLAEFGRYGMKALIYRFEEIKN